MSFRTAPAAGARTYEHSRPRSVKQNSSSASPAMQAAEKDTVPLTSHVTRHIIC